VCNFRAFQPAKTLFLTLWISIYIYKDQWCLLYLTFEVKVTWYCFALLFHLFHYKGIFVRVYISVPFSSVSAYENTFYDTMHFFIYIQGTMMFKVFTSWCYEHMIVFRNLISSISLLSHLCKCSYKCVIFVRFSLRKRFFWHNAFLHIYTRNYDVFSIFHLRWWSIDMVSIFYFIYFNIKSFCTCLYNFVIFVSFSLKTRFLTLWIS
jgi:hypothetical protein